MGDYVSIFFFWRMGRIVVFLVAFLSLVGSFVHGSRVSSTVAPPTPHEVIKLPDNASTLRILLHGSPSRNRVQSPAPVPAHLISFHKHHARKKPSSPLAPAPLHPISFHKYHARKRSSGPASAPSHLFPPPSYQQGPSLSPIQSPLSPKTGQGATAPSSSVTVPSHSLEGPIYSPTISPSGSFSRKRFRALPPPPPNHECSEVPCTEPLTNTPPGSPCGCVWPMQVGLRLSVALYTFFPLVSELAQEIAAGIFLNQSQVRIMGANAASQEPDKTVVLIDLVPLGDKFNNVTAFLAYEKFWHKMVPIEASMFGAYEVLYVQYPGLPPSPPASPTNITIDGQLSTNNKPRTMQPLGVDIRKQKERLDGGLIAVIALSSSVLLVLCVGAVWILSLKCGDHTRQLPPSPRTLLPLGKQSGILLSSI